MAKDIFNFDKGRKSIVTDNLLKSYGIDQDQQTIEKSDESTTGDSLEKGGKRAVIGEKREFSGRMYIKTATGWKFFGKGTGSKAQDHHNSAASHDSKEERPNPNGKKKVKELISEGESIYNKQQAELAKKQMIDSGEDARRVIRNARRAKSNKPIEKPTIVYRTPTQVDGDESFKQLAFNLRTTMFGGPGEYHKDTGGYDYSNGIRRHTIEVSPTKENSFKPSIENYISPEIVEKLETLGANLTEDFPIKFRLTGIETFKEGEQIKQLQPQVVIRGHNDGWILPLPTNDSQKNPQLSYEKAVNDVLDKAVWNLKFNKSIRKDSHEKDGEMSHIGIGSAASSSQTTYWGGKIDMSKYIDKYGQADLESLLKRNYAWRQEKNNNWKIENKHIVFTASTYMKYD